MIILDCLKSVMPRAIPKPAIGAINSIEFAEFEELTELVHNWRKQINQARSPVQGVVHKDSTKRPSVPTISQIPFKYAAILPLMQSKYY